MEIMPLKIVILVIGLVLSVNAHQCESEITLLQLKKPIYDFSVRFLDGVSLDTRNHFVYSPLSTWLQLLALAEGAKGRTLMELWKVTRYLKRRRRVCHKRKLRALLSELYRHSLSDYKRSSVIIVDNLYKVKNSFKKEVELTDNVKVMSLNFDEYEKSASEVNDLVEYSTDGAIREIMYPEDFKLSVLLIADAVYLKSNWKYPFNPVYTKDVSFNSEENTPLGHINMMNQISYLNYVELNLIQARILELPCSNDNLSMLIFLPMNSTITDLFNKLKKTNLVGIYNQLKKAGPRLVNASIPRFEIKTDLDVRELLFDMGVRRAFYPEDAELNGISKYTTYASLLAQVAKIEVTEESVTASVTENVIKSDGNPVEFNANKPFAFMLVNKEAMLILFAGMYSEPTLY